jgi:hypothetical protein
LYQKCWEFFIYILLLNYKHKIYIKISPKLLLYMQRFLLLRNFGNFRKNVSSFHLGNYNHGNIFVQGNNYSSKENIKFFARKPFTTDELNTIWPAAAYIQYGRI